MILTMLSWKQALLTFVPHFELQDYFFIKPVYSLTIYLYDNQINKSQYTH